MRGSVWVELEIWIVAHNRGRYRESTGTEYGFSKTQELNSRFQKEYAYQSALNQALKKYRNSHRIGSDTEINYHLIGSGINRTTIKEGYVSDKWHDTRITPARKRMIHREVYLGKDKVLTKSQIERNEEITMKGYKGYGKKLDTNKYIIETDPPSKRKGIKRR